MRAIYFSFLCATATLLSLPKEISVKEGYATFHKEADSLKIHTSNKTILHSKSFDIASHEKVEFIQPNSSSTVLSRVLSENPTHILGTLQSNGRLFLVNQNGIYFGPEAKVSSSSFLASTLDIANEDFLQDRFSFVLGSQNGSSFIRNEGIISATEGAIVLLAPVLQNNGTLQASIGEVLLSSGRQITLDFQGSHLLSFAVEGEIKDALIENLGTIEAKGGSVFLHLPTARKAIKATLNTDGIESGAVFIEENGKIVLAPLSKVQSQSVLIESPKIDIKGSVDVSGTQNGGFIKMEAIHLLADTMSILSANGSSEGLGGKVVLLASKSLDFHGSIYAGGGLQGGFVETSSLGSLNVVGAFVDTPSSLGQRGQWLIDPSLIRITASGGGIPPDCQTGGIIDVATLEAQGSTVSLCADVIVQEVPISMAVADVGLIFSAPTDTIGSLVLQEDISTRGGIIEVTNLDILLGNSVTLNTTNSGSFGANVTLGEIQSDSFPYTLTILSGFGQISLGDSGTVSALGTTTLSGSQVILSRLMTEDSSITVTGSLLVSGNSSLSTGNLGADITLNTVDALFPSSSITLDAGSLGAVSVDAIGSNAPLQSVAILRASNVSLQDVTSSNGSIVITAPTALTEPLTTFTILEGGLDSEIFIESINGSGSLNFTTNLANKVTLLSAGEVTPLDQIIIGPSREVTLGAIHANFFTLVESIGATTLRADIMATDRVNIRGGTLLLHGTINAPIVSLFSHGPTLAESSHQHIFFDSSLSIEAQGATIGTIKTPVLATTTNTHASILLGAKDFASLAGPKYESKLIQLNPHNTPCIVLFNDHTLYDCNKNQRDIFNLIKKTFFLNGYQNAQHLGIGKNPLLQLGPYFLSSYYTYDFPERIINSETCDTNKTCQGQPRHSPKEF